jgi:hypothetical protein
MALLILAPGTTIAADDPYYGGFDGRWEGMLRYIPAEAYDSEHGYAPENARFAFSIKGETVSVYINKNGGWQEYMPGAFRIAFHKTNGVIFGNLSSVEEAGGKTFGWVETWSFAFTHKDDQSLYVFFTRVVHNLSLPYDYKAQGASGRTFNIAHGEFLRMGDVKVP